MKELSESPEIIHWIITCLEVSPELGVISLLFSLLFLLLVLFDLFLPEDKAVVVLQFCNFLFFDSELLGFLLDVVVLQKPVGEVLDRIPWLLTDGRG